MAETHWQRDRDLLFALMSLGEFNNCEVVLQIYPMTAAKEDVAPRLWSSVYNSTSSCFCESGKKFALQVASKYKVCLGLYSESDAAAWAAASLPELNGSGLLVKNEKTDRPLGEGGDAGYSSEGSVPSGLGDALDDTVVLYNVPPWLEDDEVTSLLKQLDDGLSVDSITRVSWTPGDMALSA